MLNINSRLIEEMRDKVYRDGYVTAQIAIGIPNQIRALRAAREMTQGELAELAGMAQPRISEIEKPGERRLTLETLTRLAAAFDVALQVRFVPFSTLIEYSERSSPDFFKAKSFDEELAEAEESAKALKNVIPISKSQLWHGYVIGGDTNEEGAGISIDASLHRAPMGLASEEVKGYALVGDDINYG